MFRNLAFIFILLSFATFSQDSIGTKADLIDSIARSQLGVPYKYATSNPGISFDCSGFTSYVYESAQLPNSRSSKGYGSLGYAVDLKDAKKGDCIVFCGTEGSRNEIGHVGIILQNDSSGCFFIHCSSSKKHPGVVITEYFNSNYPNRFIGVRRLFD